jgi:hypothetical protein
VDNKYLVPSVHEIYRASRGPIRTLVGLGMWRLMGTIALIDVLNDNLSIGESQAQEIMDMVRQTVTETITLQ